MPEAWKCQSCGVALHMPYGWGSTIEAGYPAVCYGCSEKGAVATRGCPSCQQLQGELTAALERAERLEIERDGLQLMADQRWSTMRTLQAQGDTNARERDELRERLARAEAALKRIDDAVHRGSLHSTKKTLMALAVPLVTFAPEDAQAILDAARACLGAREPAGS